jgi:DNA ligase (NAD+)
MDKLDRVRFLVTALNTYTKDYEAGNPKITDEEWDNMYFELKALEEETNLVLGNSPTQIITYELVNNLQKATHNHKMLSLEKTKSPKEVLDFVGNKPFLAMCKMDGLTCSLTYRMGELVAAETRGNGLVGEDILHNARIIPTIPNKIPYTDELVIDGEIICTVQDFEEFSGQYKNPRNFAAGSIRLLDAEVCAKRNLTFVVWDVISQIYSEDGIELRVDQKLEMLAPFGFRIVPYQVLTGSVMTNSLIEEVIKEIQERAKLYGYPIDGAVFKFADCAYGRSLGETTHHFKNALAFKFYDDTYTTRLLDIEWTMGRTGVLTPVAIFEPVDIDGSTVERASLHNISVMSGIFSPLGPHKYQEIEVFKANMIIPQIASANKEGLYEENKILIPRECPVCGGMTQHWAENDSVVLVCIDSGCPGKLINRLDHFCGKKGLDMKGISKATLEKLIDWGWVSKCSDIFDLATHDKEWVQKPGFGVKSVEKALGAISTGSHCELHQFIAAIGIPLIGSTASKDLAKHFKTWDDFVAAAESNYPFYQLPNFGGEMHRNLVKFDYTEAKYIADHFIQFNTPEAKVEESAESAVDLTGKTFVITGKLTHFKNRDALKAKIEALGGKVTGSVSKNTSYLINNDVNSTSSKNQTARSLGIEILSEADFIETFGIA